MPTTSILVCVFVLTVVAAASAQTKLSAIEQCAKPNPAYAVPVSDRPNHTMLLSKTKCTWTKIAGIEFTDEEDVTVSDVSGNAARDRGYDVTGLASGDKAVSHFQGTSTLKDNALVSAQGTWNFTGGTGKLKGIKGTGTYTGKGNPDGTVTFAVEGEYQLPTATSSK
jgi:hypothetical protein